MRDYSCHTVSSIINAFEKVRIFTLTVESLYVSLHIKQSFNYEKLMHNYINRVSIRVLIMKMSCTYIP